MNKMIIMGGDISFAKSGFHIAKIDKKGISMVHSELFITDKNLSPIERINQTIERMAQLQKKHKVDLIIKEGAIMGRSSTGLNVIKTHGAVEYFCFDNLIPIEDMHNATLKAFCRKIVNDKTYDKKKVVAKAMEMYYNKDIEDFYTPRGRLLDDVADSVGLTVVWYEKNFNKEVLGG